MSEKNKEIMRRANREVMNQGQLALIDELVSPSFVNHNPMPGIPAGREGVKQFLGMLRQAFPDLEVTIEELVAEGNKVVARQSMRGTHKGEFMGIAATGKEVEWSSILMFGIEDGKITDQWAEADQMGLMMQLGAMEMPVG